MINFFDATLQHVQLKSQIQNRIEMVLDHGKFIMGPEVHELEEKLVEYTDAKFCITCANGTDALQIALMAAGVGPGDEVVTPAFSYISVVEACSLLGAKPVLVDVDEETFNIDVRNLDTVLSRQTKAIVPVSLFGRPANFDQINRIAKQYDILVIEDAAQSFGASLNGKKSCNLSDIACTSFFPTKPLGCYGDGGAIFTSDATLAEKIKMIARHGQSRKYQHDCVGVNSRLDSIQAAILLEKLSILDVEIAKRNEIAKVYASGFYDTAGVKVPLVSDGFNSAWAQYTLKSSKRDDLVNYLTDKGIPTAIHYPLPVNKQSAYKTLISSVPTSEFLSQTVVSIPSHAYLTDAQLNHIIGTINDF